MVSLWTSHRNRRRFWRSISFPTNRNHTRLTRKRNPVRTRSLPLQAIFVTRSSIGSSLTAWLTSTNLLRALSLLSRRQRRTKVRRRAGVVTVIVRFSSRNKRGFRSNNLPTHRSRQSPSPTSKRNPAPSHSPRLPTIFLTSSSTGASLTAWLTLRRRLQPPGLLRTLTLLLLPSILLLPAPNFLQGPSLPRQSLTPLLQSPTLQLQNPNRLLPPPRLPLPPPSPHFRLPEFFNPLTFLRPPLLRPPTASPVPRARPHTAARRHPPSRRNCLSTRRTCPPSRAPRRARSGPKSSASSPGARR